MAQAVRPEPFYTSLFYYKTISQPDPLAAGMPGRLHDARPAVADRPGRREQDH